jgi:putative restriction endonuclease
MHLPGGLRMPLVLHVRADQQKGINFETSFRFKSGRDLIKIGALAVMHAQTSSGGRYRYVAVGDIADLIEDADSSFIQAVIGNYLSFTRPIQPRKDGLAYEKPFHGLRRIRDHHSEQQVDQRQFAEFEVPGLVNLPEQETRRIIEQISQRPVRDSANRRIGLSTYTSGCAITGDMLSIKPGATLCEVHHIQPVGDRGPDSIRNLILLSPSAHRAWDAGLISLADDGKVLRSPRLRPTEIGGRSERPGYAWLPAGESRRPAQGFLRWHRENRFVAN